MPPLPHRSGSSNQSFLQCIPLSVDIQAFGTTIQETFEDGGLMKEMLACVGVMRAGWEAVLYYSLAIVGGREEDEKE